MKMMIKKAWEKDKRKVKKLVEGTNFDLFILSLICIDAVALGFMTSEITNVFFDHVLFILDRLCMAIFIMEMLMKIYAYGKGFFKNGWNVFDFVIVAISSVPFASYFIVLRTFRLFRSLKYVNKFSRLKFIINTFIALLPIFGAMLAVFAIFFYVFSIIAVCLFGDIFVEFASLGDSMFTLLQVFSLDGWAASIARPVMSVFPHAWIFFVAFLFISFLIILSFVLSAIGEVVRREFQLKSRL